MARSKKQVAVKNPLAQLKRLDRMRAKLAAQLAACDEGPAWAGLVAGLDEAIKSIDEMRNAIGVAAISELKAKLGIK